MTSETTREAVTLEQRLMEAVDRLRDGLLHSEPERREDRIEEGRARLRDIVVAATGGPAAGENTLGRVLDIIRNVDRWLDAEVDGAYAAEPLAQDWARVAKCSEEVGEAIEALIAYTGQNPRKGICGSRDAMLAELADVAVTAMFGIQHFTKDQARKPGPSGPGGARTASRVGSLAIERYTQYVLVTEMLKLAPSPEQADALLAAMRACNAAASRVAEVAYAHKTANKIRLQPLVYAELRERFGLSSQMAVRAISKACEAYKRDKTIRPVFRPLGAVAYDQRILSWKGRDRVSILTLGGRIVVPVVYQGRWLATTGTTMRAQADLIWRDGQFYLAVVIDVPEPPQGPEPDEWLGVDLGIVNLAADSDGTAYSGKAVRAVRYRNRRLRARLQSKRTKSAKRLLRKRRRKESRFARDVNHVISKRIVREAEGTRRGIKLEDLSGIRGRVKTVGKAQRADRDSWAFWQLRSFIAYKAAIAGVMVGLVDPRNTSRQCPDLGCGHISKRNRPSRDVFRCERCGLAGPADHIAARNIAGRAVSHAAVRGTPMTASHAA
jgi:IS605 OrfB family transposase